jgi:hypothetical protein
MSFITALPQEPAISPTRQDTNPFMNGAGSNADLEEERYRDRVNLVAAIVVVLLIAAGWWMVSSVVETQKAQGCYASGTRYCSLI